MAPRFIEISKPIEDGIAFWLQTVSYVLGGLTPENTTLAHALSKLPFLNEATAVVLNRVPQPNENTLYLLAMSAAAVLGHVIYVLVKTQTILASYGSTRKPVK